VRHRRFDFFTLLKTENKNKLVAILTHHVVPGKVMSASAQLPDQLVVDYLRWYGNDLADA
jgi:hypothetical protein